MITDFFSTRLRGVLTAVASIAVALPIALQCGEIQAQQKQPGSPQTATDTYPQLTSGPGADQALAQLASRIELQEHDLAKAQESYGPKDPRVQEAKMQLENSRKLLAAQKKLLELSQGESTEHKQAEISQLRNELSELVLKQLGAFTRPESENTLDSLHRTLQVTGQQLEQREKQVADLQQQLAKLEHDRALPPLENGQVKVLQLVYAKARDASNTISSLFGAQAVRVAIDDRTNSLVVFGKDDSLATVEALVMRLDSEAAPSEAGKKSVAEAGADTHYSLLLRLFWLADNVPEGGQNPEEYLPKSVLAATEKLGLNGPRLISQTVTSLSVGRKDSVEFFSDVPAIMNGQAANLNSSGKIRLLGDDDRAELAMKIQVNNPGIQCAVQGSLATPLGHYMVLGTANSVIADAATMQAMAFQQGGIGPDGAAGGGFRRTTPGGEVGGRSEFGAPGAAGPEGAAPPPAEEVPAQPKFGTSRFAFVVQVVNAESYTDEKSNPPAANGSAEPNPVRRSGR